MKPSDIRSNMSNANKGSAGTNRPYDQNQGHRGKQMNPYPGDRASASNKGSRRSSAGKK